MVGSLPACCARATIGIAAAAPRALRSSRRLTSAPPRTSASYRVRLGTRKGACRGSALGQARRFDEINGVSGSPLAPGCMVALQWFDASCQFLTHAPATSDVHGL